jgi:hypothetical protein
MVHHPGGLMFDDFRQAVWELLSSDDGACAGLLAPWDHGAAVSLVEGDLSVPDALAYARGLADMGRDDQARELFDAVLRAVLRMPAQEAQVVGPRWALAMGDQ